MPSGFRFGHGIDLQVRSLLATLVAIPLFFILTCVGSLAQQPCGTGVCGGGLICMNCPGNEPMCATPPAQCCGSAICEDGLQCLVCPAPGFGCVRPPAVCCGTGFCGDGLICVQTANGPTCQAPSAPQTPAAPQAPAPTTLCGAAAYSMFRCRVVIDALERRRSSASIVCAPNANCR